MLGTALQFGGIKGEDRFYIPVRARKNYNQQKPSRSPTKTDETESPSSKVDSWNTQGLQFQHSASLRKMLRIKES
ncbi:hypothetical protein IC582_025440 [Cucumis melo]